MIKMASRCASKNPDGKKNLYSVRTFWYFNRFFPYNNQFIHSFPETDLYSLRIFNYLNKCCRKIISLKTFLQNKLFYWLPGWQVFFFKATYIFFAVYFALFGVCFELKMPSQYFLAVFIMLWVNIRSLFCLNILFCFCAFPRIIDSFHISLFKLL